MPSAEPPPPEVRVILPDRQELRPPARAGTVAQRRVDVLGGRAMWADDPGTETVEPPEYRVWLTPAQARPIDGVRYDRVPTSPLPEGPPRPP